MKVKVLQDNFISGAFPAPVKGEIRDIDAGLANHLAAQGLVALLKVEPPVAKKLQPLSVSQAAPVSQERTAPKRRGRPKKQSQSATLID